MAVNRERDNMKKFIFITVLASLLLLSACGNSRDLSTPSSRLVGHWKSKGLAQAEYYLTAIDKETGEGKITEYAPKTGVVASGIYKIASETPEGEKITISAVWTGYEDFPPDHIDFIVQEDGMQAKMREFYIDYIDDKTEYEPEK